MPLQVGWGARGLTAACTASGGVPAPSPLASPPLCPAPALLPRACSAARRGGAAAGGRGPGQEEAQQQPGRARAGGCWRPPVVVRPARAPVSPACLGPLRCTSACAQAPPSHPWFRRAGACTTARTAPRATSAARRRLRPRPSAPSAPSTTAPSEWRGAGEGGPLQPARMLLGAAAVQRAVQRALRQEGAALLSPANACPSRRTHGALVLILVPCRRCLENRYHEQVAAANAAGDWACPRCRGECNCSNCRKASAGGGRWAAGCLW